MAPGPRREISSRRRTGREHRFARGKTRKPRRSFRMAILPAQRGEPKVEISQRAADGYRSQIDTLLECAGARLDLGQAARHLIHLTVDPVLPAQVFGTRE